MALSDFQRSYEVSPIILVGGIAGTGKLPITSLLDSQNYADGVLSAGGAAQIADTFGHFKVLPGGTLMDNEVAHYPLANQSVAANAIITQPLRIALEMIVPANDTITFNVRQSIMTALKGSLDHHTALGGWYNVSTPAYIYQGCLLVSLTDASDDITGSQPQDRWIWTFEQPLLTVDAARAAQNQAMTKISNQTQNAGDPPGSQPVTTGIGQPSSNITQNVVPASSNLQGANVSPSSAPGGTTSLSSVSPITPGG